MAPHTPDDPNQPNSAGAGVALRPRRTPRPHLHRGDQGAPVLCRRRLAVAAHAALRTLGRVSTRRTPRPLHASLLSPLLSLYRYKPRVASITDTSNFDSFDERPAEGGGGSPPGPASREHGLAFVGYQYRRYRSSSAELVGRASLGTPPAPGSGGGGDDDAPVATSTRMRAATAPADAPAPAAAPPGRGGGDGGGASPGLEATGASLADTIEAEAR